MNTDANTFDLTGIQAPRIEEHGQRNGNSTALPETPALQREAPCSCPGCFSFWD